MLGLGVVAVSCRNDAQDVQRIRQAPKGPSTVQYGVTVVYGDTSDLSWRLTADQWHEERTANGPSREVFSGCVTAVQRANGRATGTLMKADQVVRDVAARTWELHGNVLLQAGKKKTLRTEDLYWEREAGRVYGEGWVEINDQGQRLSGRGFEALDDLSRYSIFEVSGGMDAD